jgi:chemotaxis protein MotB
MVGGEPTSAHAPVWREGRMTVDRVQVWQPRPGAALPNPPPGGEPPAVPNPAAPHPPVDGRDAPEGGEAPISPRHTPPDRAPDQEAKDAGRQTAGDTGVPARHLDPRPEVALATRDSLLRARSRESLAARLLAADDASQRNPDEQHAWFLSYVDILTLLLAFFVVLLAMTRLPEPVSGVAPGQGAETAARAPAQGRAAAPPAPALAEPLAPLAREMQAAAEDLVDQFQALIERGDLQDEVEVSVSKGRVNLAMRERILFRQGRADLTEPGLRLLDRLLPLLADTPHPLSVEGHTDDVPIGTERFPSNWELSAFRATTVTRHLIRRGLPAQRLRAVAYGSTQPLADNTTASGRARNRRVALVIHIGDQESVPADALAPSTLDTSPAAATSR